MKRNSSYEKKLSLPLSDEVALIDSEPGVMRRLGQARGTFSATSQTSSPTPVTVFHLSHTAGQMS